MNNKNINQNFGQQNSKQKSKTVYKNKTDIPDNIIFKQNEMIEKCISIENRLPVFLGDFFLYIKNSIAISSRLAYLMDIEFFINYLINHHPNFSEFSEPSQITSTKFSSLSSKDINIFIGDFCIRYYVNKTDTTIVYENHSRSLARKRSSLSVLFKFLYRNGQIDTNIVDGFNPIKLPKTQPDAIKKLEVEEMTRLLKVVSTGEGLTDKEKLFWEKTKKRDKAILVLFVTYGLRVSEINQLDVASINFIREEFKIYRKRGKESWMPLNETVTKALKEYMDGERHLIPVVDTDNPLFLSIQGKRMTVRAIRDMVVKYTSIAMCTDRDGGYSPHKLRATAASSLIEFGFSIYDVQNLLDHENVTTTQLYASHKKNAKKDLIRQYELDHE